MKKRFFILATIVLSITFSFSSKKENKQIDSNLVSKETETKTKKSPKKVISDKQKQIISHKSSSIQKNATSKTHSPVEQSVSELSDLIAKLEDSSLSHVDVVVNYLENEKLGPKVWQESSKELGQMAIIRSSKSLPGTRYFHAQIEKDLNGGTYLQHLSFDMKPGPKAFESAKSIVQASVPNLGKPFVEEQSFIAWKKDGDIIWIKELGKEDILKPDPYNARSMKDIGTIRIVREHDIHPQGHEHVSNFDHSKH